MLPGNYESREEPLLGIDLNVENQLNLLQAFLAFNKTFKTLLALNYLHLKYPEKLAEKCLIYSKERNKRILGALWIQRIEYTDQ